MRTGSDTGPVVVLLERGFSFLRTNVTVKDAAGNHLGRFRSKLFSLGGGFYVYDAAGNQAAEVKGDWKSWNFRFLSNDGRELGVVSRKWGGALKELFTSADSYAVQLSTELGTNPALAALLLAAGLAVDIVFKEKSS